MTRPLRCQRSSVAATRGVSVWLDVKSLLPGVSWDEGFSNGRIQSRCILSRNDNKARFEALHEGSACYSVLWGGGAPGRGAGLQGQEAARVRALYGEPGGGILRGPLSTGLPPVADLGRVRGGRLGKAAAAPREAGPGPPPPPLQTAPVV